MQAELEEALLLQDEWTADNTAAMQRRGVLVRQVIPQWLRQQVAGMPSPHTFVNDLAVEGRDGTAGRPRSRGPACTPQAVLHPQRRAGISSTSSAPRRPVLPTLNQGTTRWRAASPPTCSRGAGGPRRLGAQCLEHLRGRQGSPWIFRWRPRRSNLGHQYELGNVAWIEYLLDSMPTTTSPRTEPHDQLARTALRSRGTSLTIPGKLTGGRDRQRPEDHPPGRWLGPQTAEEDSPRRRREVGDRKTLRRHGHQALRGPRLQR